MKIGVVSDTHRNGANLEKTTEWLNRKQKIAALYHLGDDYDDVKVLENLYLEIAQVPGTYDERYRNGTLPAKLNESVLGLQILLVHCFDKDVDKIDIIRSDIILYGHTHRAEILLEDGKLYMNPGHLKGPLDKKMPPSFGMLTILDRQVVATIYNLEFEPIHSLELLRSENGLYKAG